MKASIDYALSSEDIYNAMDGKTKVLLYSQIADYDSIDDLLSPNGNVFILYQSKPRYGHWCCLFRRNKKNIQFFDSYGFFPDSEMKLINKNFLCESNQLRKHLSHLLINSHYTINYNDKPLQEFKKGVNTCGRWCLLRVANMHMTDKAFYNAVKEQSNELQCTPDEMTCEFVKL